MKPLNNWPAFPIGKINLVKDKKGKLKKKFAGGLPPAWEKTKLKVKDIKGNGGIVPGKGKVVVDADISDRLDELKACLYKLPVTPLQETQSGGLQAFFDCPDAPEGNAIFLNDEAGELRKGNAFVIMPGSKTEQKTEWKLINSVPVATVTWKQITDAFAPFLKKEKTTNAKGEKVEINRSAIEILKDEHPSEIERVSCVMKLLAAARLKEPKISYKDAVEGIEAVIGLDNKWEDFEAKLSKKKIEGVLKKYFDKENPNEETKKLKTLNIITAKEIMNTPLEKGFIIDKMIFKNSIITIVAPSGDFKTTTALLISICATNGKDFLGYKCKKTVVTYLDKENNRQDIMLKTNKIFKGLNLTNKQFPLYFLLKEGDLGNNSFILRLKQHLIDQKVGLLIFDSLIRFSKGEENSAKDMNKIYESFIELQKETGTAILFLHHLGKSGDIRGSTDIKAQCDTVFEIKRKPKTTQFCLKNTKNRRGEINDINAEIIFGENKMAIELCEEKAEEEQKEKYDKFVLARGFILSFAKEVCVTANHSFKRAELMLALSDWNIEHNSATKVSKRKIDETIKYLARKKYLINAGKLGEYRLNSAENENISRWIEPIGLGNALNASKKETPATTKAEEVD